jgi:XisI protein
MDKLTLYQQHITDLLKTFAYKPAHGEVEVEIITDYTNNHYQVISVGWQNNRRVYEW